MNREEWKALMHEVLDERAGHSREKIDQVEDALSPEVWQDRATLAGLTRLTLAEVGVALQNLTAWGKVEVAKTKSKGPRPKNVYRLTPR